VDYEVEVETAEARRLVAVRTRATQQTLPVAIPRSYDLLYTALSGVAGALLAHNLVLFPDGAGLMSDDGALIDVGVETKSRFVVPDGLVESATPSGRVAHLTHWGPYHRLPAAHQLLHRHCAQNDLRINGVNWEVYGDWSDEPAKVRTDIYYQLV
jgi:effector-binding domain-containing protein